MTAEPMGKEHLAVSTDVIPISKLEEGREISKLVVSDMEMFGLCGKAEFFARSEQFRTILIEGETGTGKELIANLIYEHRLLDKRRGQFLTFNCANVYHVFDSDLFGHRRGSFTGAERDRKGILEAADHGFVFLDEIGRLSPVKQAKLLRFLENGTVRALGTNEERPLDVRLIIATNQDLAAMVKKGTFLPDLYYRISKIKFTVPPLAERRDDIEPLIKHFVGKMTKGLSDQHFSIEISTLERLKKYRWPGNVRELESVIERAVFRCLYKRKDVIKISPDELKAVTPAGSFGRGAMSMEEAQATAVREALKKTKGNKAQAAQILGMHRPTLYSLLDRLCINASDFKKS